MQQTKAKTQARTAKRWFATPSNVLISAALFAIALVWLFTMPSTIGVVNDPLPDPTGAFDGLLQLMDDSGEFVVAWHTWGVTHAPGYPLLSLLANIWVRLIDPLGLYPLRAAHLLSFAFAVGAFVLMALPIMQLDKQGTAVAAAILLPAFGILVWLYAVVAEAYAFGLLLAFANIWLAWQVGQKPSNRRFLLLGLLFGLAIGHHRTLIFLGPALLLAAWPARQLGWRIWLGAALLGAASLLIYLYLPLVAWAGVPWVYGRSPATWAGFLDSFLAREYSSRLLPPSGFTEILAMLDGRLRYLAQEMTTPGLALGLVGFLPGLAGQHTRRYATVLLLAFLGYFLAPVSQSLLIRSYMMILVASLTLAAAWGVGLTALGRWRPWLPILGLVLTVGVAVNTYRQHHDFILFHTKDEIGARFIEDTASLPDDSPVVGEVWGPRFFALAFGKFVTGELANVQIVDLRADLSGLPTELPQTFYTTQDVLYVASPALWEEKFGTAVALGSIGNRMIALSQTPIVEAIESNENNAEIVLREATAVLQDDQSLQVRLLWQAQRQPNQNYSIFVHVSDNESIASPKDIIVQGDRTHPVFGFYPTMQWVQGELVQDNYLITLPDERTPQMVRVGLYTVDENGRFQNHYTQKITVQSSP